MQFIEANPALKPKEIEQVEIQIKYEGYIKKALEKVEKLKRMEAKRIPENIDYEVINGLATEAKQKLKKIQPETIAQASRISGVNPADITRKDCENNRTSLKRLVFLFGKVEIFLVTTVFFKYFYTSFFIFSDFFCPSNGIFFNIKMITSSFSAFR